MVFPARKIAIFVHGCFWHSCPEHSLAPKHNAEWWAEKLERTVVRDEMTERALRDAGWNVVRVWEHEDFGIAASSIEALVRGTRPSRGRNTPQ